MAFVDSRGLQWISAGARLRLFGRTPESGIDPDLRLIESTRSRLDSAAPSLSLRWPKNRTMSSLETRYRNSRGAMSHASEPKIAYQSVVRNGPQGSTSVLLGESRFSGGAIGLATGEVL
jgi:hypothetical protein